MKVRKAIIPAAGLGTRFLPATKAQPKEMLPIVDKPTIQYIVEEAINSGIEDILIISGRGKRAIEDHFDKAYELEETLYKKEKYDKLSEIQSISNLANIHYIRQKEPKGLGHAIHCAASFIGNEPFAVLLGDDIVRCETPCLQQLIDVFDKHQNSVIGVQEVDPKDVSKYGIIAPLGNKNPDDGIIPLASVVEKPRIEIAPSNYAIMGRYILTPEIFTILETLPPGSGGEIQLTDAIQKLNENENVLAYDFDGKRYDVGDKFGFVKATIDFSLEREDLNQQVKTYLNELVGNEKLVH
ncbi:UTP--glucose-1-phosphate uridylyltransferase [Bacillus canaveralius]|uniref:UTP--glucose-1-phosphate uridylyltransferase n=1 Tax=Bacillus canaveralius TaxID=1403243 RepID=A0A2N5GN20_9BACI|nr:MULTISPECIES: UTP--glucose-1-phosphate uridylyltransferase GalU [Bacillus]PLR81381.1 UTP--glucose-1-phosphate uridylyltransferase [Bacillus sp. V33-4]PLR83531.1 UTP--glucose-1-phosphate uridylyltransferase [Bacillus canaveralius]PLS00717.1 UTP--glucose-1-phosphate uridylyltransferase [Bacillus canaveralius]RSK48606.1 UTP--glucose-1-phosphate uridylyltransferase GalU [Bacillus canaveralius]